jgi:hypothetical protein
MVGTGINETLTKVFLAEAAKPTLVKKNVKTGCKTYALMGLKIWIPLIIPHKEMNPSRSCMSLS